MTNSGWKYAKDLIMGDLLECNDNSFTKVQNVSLNESTNEIYLCGMKNESKKK